MMLLCFTAALASRSWEEVNNMPGLTQEQRVDLDQDAVYTSVKDGYVYVMLRQRINVKIFTILGQPVVQETLSPGIYRFKLTSRGIFILKAGSTTRRINI